MSIKSPETYGDQYWASQVEAARSFDEEKEQSIKNFVPSLFTVPSIRDAVPFDILPKLEGLLQFEHTGLGEVGGRFVSEAADNVVGRLLDSALKNFGWASAEYFADEHIPPEMVATLYRRKRISKDFFDRRIGEHGYSDGERLVFYEGSGPFPAPADLMRWGRYFGGEENMKKAVDAVFDLPKTEWNIWEWLSQQQYSTDQITALYKREKITDAESIEWLKKVGWSKGMDQNILDLSYSIPNAMLLMQGNLFAEASQENIFDDLGHADIHKDYRQKYFDAVLTKPASIDLVSYHLRQENQLADLDRDLGKIGIHPDYLDVYKTLAERIPPVADIISMAVREAFSPAIAARFGQYEDFPEEFGRYAAQQGLSLEWSQRYWAAHWGLPSPQQGFEMLHRGVIDQSDLGLLMKAQDIMPYWRDKMIDIAYRPLTRVDVRRMYKEGILDERGVFKAYLDAGYSDENAENMTEFTVSYVLSQQSKFTSGDIVKAYTNRMIDPGEARGLLTMIGVKPANASFIIQTANYKREWALTNQKISAIRNLYKKGQYEENATRAELLRLNLPSDQVNALLETWWYEKKEDGGPTWTKAETFRFAKAGLIDYNRVKQELRAMGYDQEHIEVYMNTIQ